MVRIIANTGHRKLGDAAAPVMFWAEHEGCLSSRFTAFDVESRHVHVAKLYCDIRYSIQ